MIDSYRRRQPSRPLEEAEEVVDSAMSPEEQALSSDEARTIQTVLSQLSPDQRRAIELRLAGLTGPEIARAMGRSHQAVKTLQFRAVERLRTLLAPLHPKEPGDVRG